MYIDKKEYDRLFSENKRLNQRVDKLESGETLTKLQEECNKWKNRYYKKNKAWENKYQLLKQKLDHERSKFNRKLKNCTYGKTKTKYKRHPLDQVCNMDEIRKLFDKTKNDYEKQIDEKDKKIKELEDLVALLRASNNKDFTNSGIPSSAGLRFKKVPNMRNKSDKKVGGQIGHQGHKRKRLEPTEPPVELAIDEKYLDSTKYTDTGTYKEKDLVDLKIDVKVIRYRSKIFVNKKTGRKCWTVFPNGVINETNYGANLKSLSFVLNNHCNVGINKIVDLLATITNQKIELSEASVCNYLKEFTKKSKEEIKEIELKLMGKHVVGVDFTNARCDGKNHQVLVAAADDSIKYYARKKKGHAGIKNSVIEKYRGILVHDHDKTFNHYGSDHQECLAHIMRYLKGVKQNEPQLTWAKLMYKTLTKIISTRNLNADCDHLPTSFIKLSKMLYDEAINVATHEYEKYPPNKYNREGYNLYKRLAMTREHVMLFLYDLSVPPTNNASERALRKVKRKMKQMTTFRSYNNFGWYCNALSLLSTWKLNNENIYLHTKNIFAKA